MGVLNKLYIYHAFSLIQSFLDLILGYPNLRNYLQVVLNFLAYLMNLN